MNVRRFYRLRHSPMWCIVLICGGLSVPPGLLQWATAAEPTPEGIEFFEKKLRPLLVEHCYECHAADEQSGGLRLDSRPAWLRGGDSGPAIVPGQIDQSLLVKAVRYDDPDLQMPPQGRLPAADIALFEQWVQMGAPDPRQESSDPASVSASGMSIEEGKQFWSMQPVRNPAVPTTRRGEWVQTPVDAFVLAQLEQAGLQPAGPAEKRNLLRRVTFDLIGLPPTPEEIAAFVADDSPAAFVQVVERLLASPQYGERWGRHWLDVARYADSNGLDENLAFGNAWRYRDYVVQAFNSDKAFDQFLVEQLAGDLLPEATPASRTATGFLVLGAKVLAEPDREKLIMDTVDEQIDATGKAFLGLTLGCARCHDHKFDPIHQADYYALAAIFKSTQTFAGTNTGAIKHWNEFSLATPAELERLKQVDAEIAAKQAAATKFKAEAVAAVRQQAKQQAADYLAAATQFAAGASLKEVEAVAEPLGLHPRILHHCRLHVEYNRDDPLFAEWHQRRAAGESSETIRDRFQQLFELAAAPAPAAAEAKQAAAAASPATNEAEVAPPTAAKLVSVEDPQVERARQALADASGFLAVPPQPQFAFDADTLQTYYGLMEEARLLESQAPDEPAVMAVADGQVQTTLPIHIRGSHRNLGTPIAREFPQVLWASSVRPILPRNSSGRLQLAQWMASTQNPLTARVIVNRLWHWHFGRGLVASTENFGVLGDQPSHPELLDWLAYRFMETGWSIKEMHRLILASSVYQMSAAHADAQQAMQLDPENQLLWKFREQRLDAEQIRDTLLAVSGRLDESLGGKTVPLRNRQFVFNHTSEDHTQYDSLRRAIYLPVIRNNLYTFFEQFDFPDPTTPTGNRQATVVAPQALLMLNDDLVIDSAVQFAQRVLSESATDEQRIAMAYEVALARLPTPAEVERSLEFIRQVEQQLDQSSAPPAVPSTASPAASPQASAWSLFCQSLMASNEFIYLE